jgi:hypothetical protein
MVAESEQGQRQEKRDSLFLSATVTTEGGKPFTTRVRNLSAGGMMIDSATDLATGTTLVAELRGIGEVKGRIAWSSPGRAGVAFDEEIDPRLARAGTPTKHELPAFLKAPVGRRPGLAIR